MFGLGVVWAAIWTPIGAGIVSVRHLARGLGFPPWSLLVPVLLDGVRNGFLAGFLFGGGLALAYRSRTFADLRPGVIGVIGAVAGMLLPAGTLMSMSMKGYLAGSAPAVLLILGFAGALGAATAVGSLRMARAAPPEVGSGDPAGPLDTTVDPVRSRMRLRDGV